MPSTLPMLYQLIQTRFSDREGERLKSFCGSVFERAPREFLEEFEPEDLLAMARGALAFLERRPPGEILVRVRNPGRDEDGWEGPYTVVEVALGDRPFIFDSMRNAISRRGCKLHHCFHPILGVRRDQEGRLIDLSPKVERGNAEAYELFLIQRIDDVSVRKELEGHFRKALRDVVLATEDYQPMEAKAAEVRDYVAGLGSRLHQLVTMDGQSDLNEYAEFMDWLTDDNFVFLGYREYVIEDHDGVRCMHVEADSALGILRKLETSTYYQPRPIAEIDDQIRKRIIEGPILLVTKSNSESTVHRPARMDYIGVKLFDEAGQAAGERRFLGLFTSKAHGTPVDRIPILRSKLKQVLALDDAIEDSHDFKQIVTIFNSMPREELFWADSKQLHRDIRTIMGLEQERGVRVTVRPDPLSRGLALMVIMPRENFNTEVRRKIQDLLTRKLQATHVDYHLAMGEDEAQIRFHFFFTTDVPYAELDLVAIDREVAELARSWEDQLREGLAGALGAVEGAGLAAKYAGVFDESYKAETNPGEALRDLFNLEKLGDSPYLADMVNPEYGPFSEIASHLKIYHKQGSLVLSEVFPFLENLGLKVIEQISHPIVGKDRLGRRGLDIFRVVDSVGRPIEMERKDLLLEAVLDLLNGRAENDRLNHLVLSAGLRIRQIGLLRAYRSYLSQLQAAISRTFITDTLIGQPDSARLIYACFEAKFGPVDGDRKNRVEAVAEAFRETLNRVTSLPVDTCLRDLFQLIEATVRTNFWLDKECISLKIRSAAVRNMPDPRPLFEILVAGRDMEGIHLRGGPVARGGLRWSDRPDDYRTEVLDLMKTQMTKNAVIVPVGSKGGFVVKNSPADRESLQQHVQRQYKTFVRGMLDLTDNIVDGQTVHPAGIEVYDDPDPYLVVAADKGTATFSDIANGISQENGFWLGDAFASGGSHGYDHKKEGITARGAWECVSRHFRELGLDVKKHDFTAVGIGDMSGDVFGNGMLHTPTMHLLAAFNHQHIFIDPDPDAARAFRERQRLFALPRSSWDDYDREAISAGGGVFERQAKSIPLTPQIRRTLGVQDESLSGQAIIQAILKMPVDLLWNGGIGTYVKAASERNSDVRDTANDGVRVDATELRARVVGEGGNLGFTQLARIEYCLGGGRMNTDAIDNSAGVDMSDHEVNIKILLQPMLKRGELSFEQRNQLLSEMTDDVSRLVLEDNYSQSLCLSLAERASRQDLDLFRSLMERLVEKENLRTDVERLPGPKILEERARQGLGLTRPELAILLAYSKMGFTRRLLQSSLPDEPHFQRHLAGYFPRLLRERHDGQMKDHPLRREIVVCQLTNLVVDRLGLAFTYGVERDTGAPREEVSRATLAALAILDLNELWDRIFALDNQIGAERQLEGLEEIVKAVSGVVHWILLADVDIGDFSGFIQTYREPLLGLRTGLEAFLPADELKRFQGNKQTRAAAGYPEALATELTSMEYLTSGMGVIDIANISQISLEDAARHYYAIGDRLALGWLRDSLADLPKRTIWDRVAAGGLIMDLRAVQRRLAIGFVRATRQGGVSINSFFSDRPRILKRFDDALAKIRAGEGVNLTTAAVLTRLLAQIGS